MADIKVKIGADASQFESAMNGMKSHMNKLAMISGGAILGFKALSSVASTAASAIQSAGSAFLQFSQSSSQKAAQMESLTMAFETLTDNAETAKELISQFREEAQKSPLKTSDYAQAAQKMLIVGKSASEIMPTLKMLGDVSMGNALKFDRLALAYSQVMSKGRLMGQENNQLAESGFSPLAIISERTGKSMADLMKVMEDGGISSGMVTEAFKIATSEGGRFFGAIQRGAETMEGKMAQAQDSVEMLQIAFGEGMNKGLKVGLDAISAKLPEYNKAFAQVGNTFGNAIADAVNGDSEKLLKIGMFIGELIKEGLKLALLATGTETAGMLLEGASKYTPQGMAYRTFRGDKVTDRQVSTLQGYGRQQIARDTQSTLSRIRESSQNTFGYGDPNAVIQGMRGTKFRYAQPGESSPFVDPATNYRIIEILQRVADNTAPSGRAFP
jgi:tape measure domain-containing protein